MISPAINQKRKSESDVLEAEAQKDVLKQKEPQKKAISSPLVQNPMAGDYGVEQPAVDMTKIPNEAISRLDPNVQQYYKSKIPTSPIESGDPLGSIIGLRHQHLAQSNLQQAEDQARHEYENRFDVKHPYLNTAKNIAVPLAVTLGLQGLGASGLVGKGLQSIALREGGRISSNQAKMGNVANFSNIAKRSQNIVGAEGLGGRVGIPMATALTGKAGAKGMPEYIAAHNRMNAVVGMAKAPRLSNVKMNIAGMPLSLADVGSIAQIKELPQFAKIKASDVYNSIEATPITPNRSNYIKQQIVGKLRKGLGVPAKKDAKDSLKDMIKGIKDLNLKNEKDLVNYAQGIANIERDRDFAYYRQIFADLGRFLKDQVSGNNKDALAEADRGYAGYKLLSSILDKSNKTGDIDIVKMARSLNTQQRGDLNSALKLLGMRIDEGADYLEGNNYSDKFIDYLTKSFVKEWLTQGENAVNLTPIISALKSFQGKSSIPWLRDIIDTLTLVNQHKGSVTSQNEKGGSGMGSWMMMSMLQQTGLDAKTSFGLANAMDMLTQNPTEAGIQALVEEIGADGISDLTKILNLDTQGKNYGILGDAISYLRKLLSGANNG